MSRINQVSQSARSSQVVYFVVTISESTETFMVKKMKLIIVMAVIIVLNHRIKTEEIVRFDKTSSTCLNCNEKTLPEEAAPPVCKVNYETKQVMCMNRNLKYTFLSCLPKVRQCHLYYSITKRVNGIQLHEEITIIKNKMKEMFKRTNNNIKHETQFQLSTLVLISSFIAIIILKKIMYLLIVRCYKTRN